MTYQPTFPASLQTAASALLRQLPAPDPTRPLQGFRVTVQGETLSAPNRIYLAAGSLYSILEESEGEIRTLALCFGTRHCDGYVREECLRQLLAAGSNRDWVVPFIVQLLGEYVIEIIELIADAIPNMNPAHLASFSAANPEFMALTRRRVTSYWDCYHRDRYGRLELYPGSVALNAIEHLVLTQTEPSIVSDAP
ncbi:hypothetical protein [Roseateles terrae]|uniref:Uncharacterized protein n=1 Tax=Roseateles terrae TaxID=431060 RepID=A0ABR6GSI3_9BURK|nr:hypothetical protein [Roseateles terrae]MBB3195051.1 hypothetical protein [Roseateles terrae]